MKHLFLFLCLACFMQHSFSQCRPVFVKQPQQPPSSSKMIMQGYVPNYHQVMYMGTGNTQVTHHLWDDSVWTNLPATDFKGGSPVVLKWNKRLIGVSIFCKGFDSTRADSNKVFVFLEFRNNRWDTLTGGVFDSMDAMRIRGWAANRHGLYYHCENAARQRFLFQYDSASQKFVQKAIFEAPSITTSLMPGNTRLLISNITKINGTFTRGFAYIDRDSIKVNTDTNFNPSMVYGIDQANDHIYSLKAGKDPVVKEYSDSLLGSRTTTLPFDNKSYGYYLALHIVNGTVMWNHLINNKLYINVLCTGNPKWKTSIKAHNEWGLPSTASGKFFMLYAKGKQTFVLGDGSVLQGRAYVDLDSNCSFNDSLDYPFRNRIVSARSLQNDYVTSALTDSTGAFEIFVARDSFVLSGPGKFSSCVTDTMVVTADTAMKDVVQWRPDYYDLKADFNSGFRARWNGQTFLLAELENRGERADSAHFELKLDPRVKITSVDSQVTYFNDSVARGVIRNLGYYEKRQVRIMAWIDSGSTKPDTTVCHDLSAYLFNSEKDSSNNRDNICQKVVYSLDPNHKDCDREIIPVNQATRLEYFIQFENEGNDDAYDVVVTDMLSTKLDTRTLTILGASHPYTVSKEGQTLSFTFKDIFLRPKKQDSILSKGFIRFSIMTRPGLQDMDSITNKAYIYFDLNKPIITNTSVVMVSQHVSISERPAAFPAQIQAYPNPLSGRLTVIALAGEEIWVYDINGRVMHHVMPINGQAEIETTVWPAGLYFVRSGNSAVKLLKTE